MFAVARLSHSIRLTGHPNPLQPAASVLSADFDVMEDEKQRVHRSIQGIDADRSMAGVQVGLTPSRRRSTISQFLAIPEDRAASATGVTTAKVL